MAESPTSQMFDVNQTVQPGAGAGSPQATVLEKTRLESEAAGQAALHADAQDDTYGRYVLLKEHALGGLGRVSQALDTKLGRTVALKEIRPDRRPGPDAMRRFVNEAAVTALLEHPGIVPIYSLDEDASGKPYYAMRFIAGISLHEAIGAYHGEPNPIAFRKILNHFIAVCNAVGFAHSRGVIHRDLKPENVMLGNYGETLVVDWGLAKQVRNDESRRTHEEPRPDEVLKGQSSIGILQSSMTQDGSVMGTPAFMSPEQARGEIAEIGTASDIYSLGAILYTVLTGRPPFAGSVPDVLPLVQSGARPVHPTLVNKDADPCLAAVCLQAMAPLPRDRYGSATEMIADLERWLADEPTSVYADPLTQRARRWMRKHRTAVMSCLVLLISVAVLAVAIAFLSEQGRRQVLAEKDNTEKERSAAVAARERERAAKLQARQQLRTLFSESQLRDLQRQQQLTKEQEDLLRTLADFYRECTAEAPQTEAELAQQTRDFFQLGWMLVRLGQPRKALEAYGDAVRVCDKLVDAYPGKIAYQADLARALNNLGVQQSNVARDPAAAEASYRRASRLYSKLSEAQPNEPEHLANLAKSWNNLGTLQQAMQHMSEAADSYEQSRRLFEKLCATHSHDLDYQASLAAAWNNTGLLQEARKQLTAAHESYVQACRLQEQVTAAAPEVADHAVHLAGIYGNLGNITRDLKRYDEALASYEKSLAGYARVLQKEPRHPTARLFYRNTVWGRAIALEEIGRYAESVRDWNQALALDNGTSAARLQKRRRQALQQAVRQAELYARLGWHPPALHAVAILTTQTDLSPSGREALARTLALCSLSQSPWFFPSLSVTEREHNAAKAVQLLQHSRMIGFFASFAQAEKWSHDAAFMPLRNREDFRVLVGLAKPVVK